jgi:hypothetical protein
MSLTLPFACRQILRKSLYFKRVPSIYKVKYTQKTLQIAAQSAFWAMNHAVVGQV